jgi:uncharacterized protein YcbX
MSTPAKITAIYRYPVKGFSPEAMTSVVLSTGATIPYDRAYAIENGPTGFDPAAPSYFPKIRFLMLMRDERIAKLQTTFDPATTLWRIEENGVVAVQGRLNDAGDRARIEAWIAGHFATELRGAPKILAGEGHSFSDVARKVLHIVNLASVRDLERQTGQTIDPLRFRANVYVDGLAPWQEFEWIDASVASGDVVFNGVKRTVRCAATNVDPATGARDLNIPHDLMRLYGHADCGIYLEVTSGGTLSVGDTLDVPQMALDLGA